MRAFTAIVKREGSFSSSPEHKSKTCGSVPVPQVFLFVRAYDLGVTLILPSCGNPSSNVSLRFVLL